MTSRTTGRNKKPKVDPNLKYRDMTFSIEDMPGCCGIGVVNYFREEQETTYDWSDWRGRAPVVQVPYKYATKQDQAEACYKKILEKTWGDAAAEEYSCLMIALVSCYGDNDYQGGLKGEAQYPELEEILQREGWQINQVFINPNHGNEVTLYTKYFPDRTEVWPNEDDDGFDDH